MEITWRVISEEWEGERGGKHTEYKQHKWQVENRQGEVKNSIGNVEAKELICTTHGHELKGNSGGRGCAGQRGIKQGGEWDNCNSTINKIYFLKKDSWSQMLARMQRKGTFVPPVGGNINWCSHYGKQCGGSSRN